ncbi:hypothetical protein EVJ58_g5876 [Rhodofomes roseus]|uniref:Uncharacterized protein n=1 Tax=Rhodofomes roseus TaxID=34475 RepID=A0A4Y9YBM6_9APHY|nr:hypothetical protein EVJ58_g5876 [Rhodofomes roseus]
MAQADGALVNNELEEQTKFIEFWVEDFKKHNLTLDNSTLDEYSSVLMQMYRLKIDSDKPGPLFGRSEPVPQLQEDECLAGPRAPLAPNMSPTQFEEWFRELKFWDDQLPASTPTDFCFDSAMKAIEAYFSRLDPNGQGEALDASEKTSG